MVNRNPDEALASCVPPAPQRWGECFPIDKLPISDIVRRPQLSVPRIRFPPHHPLRFLTAQLSTIPRAAKRSSLRGHYEKDAP
jgi:hypothetical protein